MRNVVYQEADTKSVKINMLTPVSSEINFNVSSVSQGPVSIEIFWMKKAERTMKDKPNIYNESSNAQLSLSHGLLSFM